MVPPSSVVLISEIHKIFSKAGVPEHQLMQKTAEYFRSETLERIPFLRIAALLWASVARKASAGQKKPPTRGMVTDIEILSTLLPYCDAMLVDRECAGYLREEPVRSRLGFPTRVFSMADKNQLLDYLDDIHDRIPEDHLRVVEEVYGSDWPEPFTAMYETDK